MSESARHHPGKTGISPVAVLVVYLATVLVGGALLAPWLWKWMQQSGPESLRSQPFHRYVNRCFYVVALIGLWPLLRSLRLPGLADLGWRHSRDGWRNLGTGFAVGWISLACVAAMALIAGGREWAGSDRIVKHLLNAMASAAVVALLEEMLFRGVIWTALFRAHGPTLALWVSSAIYSWVHFFAKPGPPAQVGPWTGLEILGKMSEGFVDVSRLLPGFLSLMLAGGVLAKARELTGAIWWSMGLHAGWIFWLKSYGRFCLPTAGASESIWGTGKLYDGWVAFLGIAVAGWLMLRWIVGSQMKHPQPT